MCGIVGFFTGCKLASVCKKNIGKLDYRSAFNAWDQRASVRRSPLRTIDPSDSSMNMFPMEFAPVASHPLIQEKYPQALSTILALHLVRYMKFTQVLELVVVNDVTKSIAFGHQPIALPKEMQLDAHKLYCDEAYHALFSVDIASQVQTLTGLLYPADYTPSFLLQLERNLSQTNGTSHRESLKLLFVIVSEMLITSNLADVGKSNEMPTAVASAIRDHAADEARHHAFYRQVLRNAWPQLDDKQKTEWIAQIPTFLSAFIDPDREAITKELHVAGIASADIDQILLETYRREDIEAYRRVCSRNLTLTLEELGGLDKPHHRDILENAALI